MGKEKSETIPIVINYRIIHKGKIDIYTLFRDLPKWFGSFSYDFWETGLSQKDTGIGEEYMSDWKAVRDVNDYIQYEIALKVFIKDITKTKVKGKEVFVAQTEIYLNSKMKKNYRKSFGPDKFQQFLRQIYERYIRYHDLLEYEDKLVGECVDLINLLKANLK